MAIRTDAPRADHARPARARQRAGRSRTGDDTLVQERSTRPDDRRPGRSTDGPRLRRNPRWIALGLTLTCLGGVASFVLYTGSADRQSVVVITRPVARGEVIERTDLRVTDVVIDGLAVVPAAQLESVVGRRAAVDLTEGSLLPPGAVATVPVPAPDRAVVGVRLAEGRAPVDLLAVGSPITLVAVAAETGGGAEAAGEPAASIAAVVVSVVPSADGQAVVLQADVAAADAAEVARLAAENRIAVVRDAEG